MAETPPNALDLVAVERKRQVDEEGWTPEHDDGHRDGQLAQAAVCYAYALPALPARWPWPWERATFKKSIDEDGPERIRDLVKAGALIVAEIERLQRAFKVSDA